MNRILLLNLNYEPLYVCSLSRAMKLLIMGKAETLHFKDDTYFFTGSGQQFQVPSVIRLKYNIKKKNCKMNQAKSYSNEKIKIQKR